MNALQSSKLKAQSSREVPNLKLQGVASHLASPLSWFGIWRLVFLLSFELCALSFSAFAQSQFVSENADEFYAAGDFDADGREDIVIVDRATGSYRVGYQTSPGVHTWVKARASGIEDVASVSLGALLFTNRPGLAATSQIGRAHV